MAIRHFTRRSNSKEESDSSDEEPAVSKSLEKCELVTLKDGILQSNEENEGTKSTDEYESNASSTESSSGEEDIPLLKPVLANKRPQREELASSRAAKRSLLRAAYLNDMNDKTVFDRRLLNSDIADKNFLDKVVALDDTDGVDCEKEQKDWEYREELRANRRRKQKLQIQREIEEQELQKTLLLTRNNKITADIAVGLGRLETNVKNGDSDLSYDKGKGQARVTRNTPIHPSKDVAKPRRLVGDLVKMNANRHHESNQDTEYAHLGDD